MDIHRIIPVLLLRGTGLVKTRKFEGGRYVGDIINAVNIFNEKLVDEIIILDIDASAQGMEPNLEIIGNIASECFMPMCYGGGITSVRQAEKIFKTGVEKIAINTSFYQRPRLLPEIAGSFGSQSVVVSIDVRGDVENEYCVNIHNGQKPVSGSPLEHARRAVEQGAGELLIQSIDRDGTLQGYDINLIQNICESVNVPVIAAGGAGNVSDLASVIVNGGAAAAAAGSMFVFYGRHQAVLITIPDQEQCYQHISFEREKLHNSDSF